MNTIVIRGARQHNLKNLSLEIPRNAFVVITGVSGSGKSSLAFDTLYAEGRRRYIESLSAYARHFLDQRAKPDVDTVEGLAPAIAIEQRGLTTSPRSTVATVTEIADYLRLLYARVGTPYCLTCARPLVRHSVPQIVDQILSLPAGSRVHLLAPIRLQKPHRLASTLRELHLAGFVRVRLDGTLYELGGELPPLRQPPARIDLVVDRLVIKGDLGRRLADSLETAFRYGHDVVTVVIDEQEERLYTQRLLCPECGFTYPDLTPGFFSPNSPEGACPACDGLGIQAITQPGRKTTPSEGEDIPPPTVMCPVCRGTRLRKESQGVRIHGRTIAELCALSIAAASAFFATLTFTGQQARIAAPLCQAISSRLRFLREVGLDYLTLDRPTSTLSGGEAQRIRLATQIGAGLSGVLYVLDEPSIGLHPRDTARLVAALHRLRDSGNTVIVVEHDRDTILAADHVIDLGPGAGEHGGMLLAAGTPQEVMNSPASLTGRYLSGQATIPLPARRRQPQQWLTLTGVSRHNLKNVTVAFPLGTLTCVTGVSGSGKSTLVLDVLFPALSHLLHHTPAPQEGMPSLSGWQSLKNVIRVDQTPIGRTPHSNPATYIGLLTPIRTLFAQLPEARVRGYGPERFSFNVKGGRCEACEGNGIIAVEMHFLPDLYVACDVCHGTRYNRDTLAVHLRGKNIAQVLDLTVNEALEFFADIPTVRPWLDTLRAVGLAYLRLGQPAPTLSAGEAQRLKLAKALGRRSNGRTLYILDEPTTGLHFADIAHLLTALQLLVDSGNTVLVIEHNLDVIKTADFIIDLGPEGGEQGGEVVAAGTPEEVARVAHSYTGRWLRPVLQQERTRATKTLTQTGDRPIVDT